MTKNPYMFILKFVINRELLMSNKIKICTGPGCKAWNSMTIACRLKKLQGSHQVCLVPCMNKCGGGASVRLKDRGRIIKLKETNDIVGLLKNKIVALAQVG